MKTDNSKKSQSVKKRGRRIKKVLTTESIENKKIADPENRKPSAVILGLNIDPSKILAKKKAIPKKIEESDDEDNSDSPTHLFDNDLNNDMTCSKCVKQEKIIDSLKAKLNLYEKNEQQSKNTKFYTNNLSFVSYKTGKPVTIKKTSIKCWWDTYTFNTLPCFLPELFHDSTYHVIGCFCSFNCALAYNLYYLKDHKIYQRKSLVYKLYREIYKLKIEDEINIKEAPPKEILNEYGGNEKMTIEKYRRSFITMNKEYVVFFPPLKPINMIIEEKITDNENTEAKYVLKRSKPFNNEKSVISLMKMNFNQ